MLNMHIIFESVLMLHAYRYQNLARFLRHSVIL